MVIDGLKVPGFNTSLMGVVRGVADYFGLPHSDAAIYGGSSHAFLINIHEQLCPSGPYCWKPVRFRQLLGNLGIAVTDHGFFGAASDADARDAVEACLRGHLDAGRPCSLLNMENQLITGYDASGFDTTQPWAPHADFPPARLSFGTWAELGDEVHLSFFSYAPLSPADECAIAAQALACAADMVGRPEEFTEGPYAAGPRAYDHWIAAVEAGHGSAHGNWWNGTVWSECRARAADYLREVEQAIPEVATPAAHLAATYGQVAQALERVSDKEMDAGEKVVLLRRTQMLERDTGPQLAEILDRLPEATGAQA